MNPLLLPLVLDRIEASYAQVGFASEFRTYFETYLADIDPDTEGAQQYRNCDEVLIETLEQAFWCGPSQTWPQEEYNFAYIEFWHRLDRALAGDIADVNVDQISDLGPATLNDQVWTELVGPSGGSFDGITVRLTERFSNVIMLGGDQLGNTRPANALSDIGAIEVDN